MTSAVFARLAKLINWVFLMIEGMPSSMNVRSVKYTPNHAISHVTQWHDLFGQPTKEGDARRIGEMQCLSVFAEVLGAVHQLPHLF